MRDPETGSSRGFGFVNYDSFEAADLAIQCMHQQVRSLLTCAPRREPTHLCLTPLHPH